MGCAGERVRKHGASPASAPGRQPHVSAARDGRVPIPHNVGEAEIVRAIASNHDEIDAVRHEIGPQPEALTAEALDAVALDGAADFFRDDDAEARRSARGRLRGDQHREMRRRDARPCRLHAKKVRPLSQTSVLAEREPRGGCSRARGGHQDRAYFL